MSSGATDEYVWIIPRQKNNTSENCLNVQWAAGWLTNSPEIYLTILKLLLKWLPNVTESYYLKLSCVFTMWSYFHQRENCDMWTHTIRPNEKIDMYMT